MTTEIYLVRPGTWDASSRRLGILIGDHDVEIFLRFIALPPGPGLRGRVGMGEATMALETGRRRLRECVPRRDHRWFETTLNALEKLVDEGLERGGVQLAWRRKDNPTCGNNPSTPRGAPSE